MDKQNTNKMVGLAATGIAIAVVSFWGGMTYQRTKTVNNFRNFTGRTGTSTQQGTRNRIRATMGNTQTPGMMGGRGFVAGEVSKVEDGSITVKMQDGSSRIVILTQDTKYTSSTTSSKDNLKEGSKVTVQGSTGTEGVTTATNVMIGN